MERKPEISDVDGFFELFESSLGPNCEFNPKNLRNLVEIAADIANDFTDEERAILNRYRVDLDDFSSILSSLKEHCSPNDPVESFEISGQYGSKLYVAVSAFAHTLRNVVYYSSEKPEDLNFFEISVKYLSEILAGKLIFDWKGKS